MLSEIFCRCVVLYTREQRGTEEGKEEEEEYDGTGRSIDVRGRGELDSYNGY